MNNVRNVRNTHQWNGRGFTRLHSLLRFIWFILINLLANLIQCGGISSVFVTFYWLWRSWRWNHRLCRFSSWKHWLLCYQSWNRSLFRSLSRNHWLCHSSLHNHWLCRSSFRFWNFGAEIGPEIGAEIVPFQFGAGISSIQKICGWNYSVSEISQSWLLHFE